MNLARPLAWFSIGEKALQDSRKRIVKAGLLLLNNPFAVILSMANPAFQASVATKIFSARKWSRKVG